MEEEMKIDAFQEGENFLNYKCQANLFHSEPLLLCYWAVVESCQLFA